MQTYYTLTILNFSEFRNYIILLCTKYYKYSLTHYLILSDSKSQLQLTYMAIIHDRLSQRG